MQFPNVDPLPVPAPIWLLKVLDLLTLALHFFAVQILVGSLLAVLYFSWRGSSSKNGDQLSVASVLAKRLPVVMTYVINLGVPPLLFTQVLYGRALYTSSVLMGAVWISVIFLVMFTYWLLYKTNERALAGKPVWLTSLIAFVVVAVIGHIYTWNMTLMLRPEVWQSMYANTATGAQLPPNDPSSAPRFLFVLTGGFTVGGLWMLLLSNIVTIEAGVKAILQKTGGMLAALGAVLQLGLGYLVYNTQPDAVKQALAKPAYAAEGTVCTVATGVWLLGGVLVIAIALLLATRKTPNLVLSILGCVAGFLGIAGSVIYRDGIRDATLYAKGFDVWNRTEVANWGVVGLFLLLFVGMLGVVIWLLWVMKIAKANSEMVNV